MSIARSIQAGFPSHRAVSSRQRAGNVRKMGESARALVVVGASAGGVGPLKELAASLPRDLPAAVAVVLHVAPHWESGLPAILTSAGPLPAAHAADGEPLLAGRVYIAPPDRHLLVQDGRCRVVRGPRENLSRPAIDPLFRSAALAFGRRAVAVVLSGTRDDGVAGARAVSAQGGTVLVQDPGEAAFSDMPSNTISGDHPDHVLPLAEIGPVVARTIEDLPQEDRMREDGRDEMTIETSYAALDREAVERSSPPGTPTGFSCPACGGVLWELDDGGLLRFRCRVGHAYSADAALDDHSEGLDRALWAALRALHEQAELANRIADRSHGRGRTRTCERFDEIAQTSLAQANVIRTFLLERDGRGE
jgi:two-component system chemotaxis response regulator CheB